MVHELLTGFIHGRDPNAANVRNNGGMPRRTDAYRGLSHASRFQILEVVRGKPGVCLIEISALTGLHKNTLRDHVRVLLEQGLISTEIEHRPNRGRPRNVFYAVDAAVRSELAQHRVDEAKRHGDLLRQITPIETGDFCDEALHQIDAVYEHLEEVGLQPEMDEGSAMIELRPCQFHGMLEDHQKTVCAVHEVLIRDVLERAGGPLEVDKLLPMVTSHTCQLHLRASGAQADAAVPTLTE